MKRLVGGAGGLFLSACVGSPGQIVNRTMRPEVASTTVGMLIEGGDPFLALAPRG